MIVESQSSQQVTVDEYSNVTLTCKTSAHPKATTTWKRDDGLPIRLNGRPSVSSNIARSHQMKATNRHNLDKDQIGPGADIATDNNNNNNDDYHMTAIDNVYVNDDDNDDNRDGLIKSSISSTSSAAIPNPRKFNSIARKKSSETGGAISVTRMKTKQSPIVISSPIG